MNHTEILARGEEMREAPKQYANKPNLWRLACWLSQFNDPNKVVDLMLVFAESELKRIGHQKDAVETEAFQDGDI